MFWKRSKDKEETKEQIEKQAEEQNSEEINEHIGEQNEEQTGFFSRLKNKLFKTKTEIVSKIKKVLPFHKKIDEELLEEIEEILIQADLGVETTLKIVDRIRDDCRTKGIQDPEQVIDVLKQIIKEMISKDERVLNIETHKPYVILVAGVNGVGKTTTIAKLAKNFGDAGKKVMLVAGDTFRAAAIEQLEIWAKRTNSEIIKQSMGADAAAVCYDALQAALVKNIDIVIIDTAGRLHTKVNLMEELKKIVRVIKKSIPDAPHETLLVLDATTGQNAISQTKIFSDAVDVSGIIMTKLDSTAKGGILIAIRDLYNTPVLMIGVGEQQEDLRPFDPNQFVDALFEA